MREGEARGPEAGGGEDGGDFTSFCTGSGCLADSNTHSLDELACLPDKQSETAGLRGSESFALCVSRRCISALLAAGVVATRRGSSGFDFSDSSIDFDASRTSTCSTIACFLGFSAFMLHFLSTLFNQ